MVLGRDQIAWLFVLTLTVFVVWRLLSPPPKAITHPFFRRLRADDQAAWRRPAVGLVVAGPPLLWTIALAQQSNRAEITLDGGDARLAASGFAAHRSGRQSLWRARAAVGLLGAALAGLGRDRALYRAQHGRDLFRRAALSGLARPRPRAALGCSTGRCGFSPAPPLVLAIYAFGKYTPVFAALFDVPGANLFRRPADATFPLCVFAGVIGGYCVAALHRRAARQQGAQRRPGAGRRALLLSPWASPSPRGIWPARWPALAFPCSARLCRSPPCSARGAGAKGRRLACCWSVPSLTFDLSLNNAPNQSTAPAAADL